MITSKPHILLLMTDQFRFDAINLNERKTKHTPNLDELAQSSVQFTNCITNSPICAPARASLLSGLYPHQMGIWDNSPHIFPKDVKNWVKMLQCLGYHTSVFGKTHYYPYNGSVPDMREAEPLLHSYGFETVDEIPGPRVSGTLLSHMTALWEAQGYRKLVQEDLDRRYAGKHTCNEPSPLPLDLYPDTYVGQKANTFLQEYKEEEPFFCFVSFGGPHDPWDCPQTYTRRFESVQMEPPCPSFIDAYPKRKRGNWDEGPHHPPLDCEDIPDVRRNYAGKVSMIDEQIGIILATIKERGWWENTLILFTSDHGEMLGDYGRLYKQNFLNPSLRIPLLVKPPGAIQKSQCPALVELLDLGPSIVDWAQGTLAYPQMGASIKNLIENREKHLHQVVFSEYKGEIMAWDGTWKLVVNNSREPYLLFNHDQDPNEQVNLAGGNLKDETRLLKEIENHLIRTQHIGFSLEEKTHG